MASNQGVKGHVLRYKDMTHTIGLKQGWAMLAGTQDTSLTGSRPCHLIEIPDSTASKARSDPCCFRSLLASVTHTLTRPFVRAESLFWNRWKDSRSGLRKRLLQPEFPLISGVHIVSDPAEPNTQMIWVDSETVVSLNTLFRSGPSHEII